MSGRRGDTALDIALCTWLDRLDISACTVQHGGRIIDHRSSIDRIKISHVSPSSTSELFASQPSLKTHNTVIYNLAFVRNVSLAQSKHHPPFSRSSSLYSSSMTTMTQSKVDERNHSLVKIIHTVQAGVMIDDGYS
jgi:hypothetical protein